MGWTDGNGVDLMPDVDGQAAPGQTATATGVVAQYFVLTFDQPMLADSPLVDPDSVYNPSNYQIYNASGNQLDGVISNISYGLSDVAQVAGTDGLTDTTPDNRWEVVLTLDSEPGVAGLHPLPNGTYTLKVLNAVPASATSVGQPGLRNLYGEPLNLTGYNPNGSNFIASVTISTTVGTTPAAPGLTTVDTPINQIRGGLQTDPTVATANDSAGTAANGNYVTVWTSDIGGLTNIVGQLYTAAGTEIGQEFTINVTASTTWGQPSVAMDAAGDFVVVWSGFGPNSNAQTDPSDIFGRQYNAKGQALTGQFQVDLYQPPASNDGIVTQIPGVQNDPSVAMAPDGTFIVTWASTPVALPNTNPENTAIFGREYTSEGVPIDNAFQPDGFEFQVSPSSQYANVLPNVSMDAKDDFVVVWEGDDQSEQWGLYGDYFYANGQSTGAALLNNTPNSRSSFTGQTATDLKDTGPRGRHEHGRRLRGDLGRFHQHDQRLRHLRPAIRARRRAACPRVPGQPDLGFLLEGDAGGGRRPRGQLHHCLGGLRPGQCRGRQPRGPRLWRLRPDVQCRRHAAGGRAGGIPH